MVLGKYQRYKHEQVRLSSALFVMGMIRKVSLDFFSIGYMMSIGPSFEIGKA
jgi:hypothetical protein